MYHNFIVLSIYTTIMSGNLKRKRCAYDTNFKLKVIQYSEECKNNRRLVEHTAAGNRKRPSLPIVTQWAKTAWDSIDPATIVRAFKKCSITNELEGTEDDRDALCADSDIEGENIYNDMLTTDQMIQMLEEDDSDKEFLGFD